MEEESNLEPAIEEKCDAEQEIEEISAGRQEQPVFFDIETPHSDCSSDSNSEVASDRVSVSGKGYG